MIVMMPSKVGYRNDEPGLLANDVFALEDSEKHLSRAVRVRIRPEMMGQERLEKLAELLGNSRGNCDVYLHCTTATGKEVTVHPHEACLVPATRPFLRAIESIMGHDNAWLSGGMGLPSHRPPEIVAREKKPWEKK